MHPEIKHRPDGICERIERAWDAVGLCRRYRKLAARGET